jgi:predicted nucleic acid-binding protein
MPGNFFDSNILIYLASGDSSKADRADAVLCDIQDGVAIDKRLRIVNPSRERRR